MNKQNQNFLDFAQISYLFFILDINGNTNAKASCGRRSGGASSPADAAPAALLLQRRRCGQAMFIFPSQAARCRGVWMCLVSLGGSTNVIREISDTCVGLHTTWPSHWDASWPMSREFQYWLTLMLGNWRNGATTSFRPALTGKCNGENPRWSKPWMSVSFSIFDSNSSMCHFPPHNATPIFPHCLDHSRLPANFSPWVLSQALLLLRSSLARTGALRGVTLYLPPRQLSVMLCVDLQFSHLSLQSFDKHGTLSCSQAEQLNAMGSDQIRHKHSHLHFSVLRETPPTLPHQGYSQV